MSTARLASARAHRGGRLLGLLSAFVVVAALAGDSAQAVGQATTGPPPASLVRFAIPGDENNLAPFAITFQSGKTEDLVAMVYDSLFASSSELDPEPLVAEGAEMSPDAKTWTMKIRSGITWHDGLPLTADDVNFTYEYFFKHQSGLYSHHVNDQPYVERVELVAPDTVRFTCRNPCATFNIDPGGHVPIMPRHIWESVTEPAKFTTDLPVGSGPYKVVQHVPDQLYRLQANESYFMGRPTVDEIQMPIIKESASMFLALRSGQVDAVSRSAPPESLEELRRAGLEIVEMPGYSSVQVFLNNQRPPFTLPQFRKALNLATDTAAITTTLLGDKGRPGVESFLSFDSPYVNPSLRHEHDPVRAGQLLDGLGFRDANGDGIRETAEGRPLDFEILVSSIEAREVRASELLADQLEQVGVKLRVAAVDPVTLRARRQPRDATKPTPQRTMTGDYDMYVGSFISLFHFHADPDGLLYVFHCPGTTGFGASQSGYCNPRFDELVERAATLAAEERKPLFAEAQQVLFDDPPIISLYFPLGIHAYRPEAYPGWVPTNGHGIFNRFSFLPGERTASPPSALPETSDERSLTVPFVIVGAVVILAVGTVALARGRRSRAGAGEPSGPEVE